MNIISCDSCPTGHLVDILPRPVPVSDKNDDKL